MARPEDREISLLVGLNVRRMRLEDGLTMHDLAMKTGLREAFICQIENPGNTGRNGLTGVKAVTVDQLMVLMDAFDCSFEEITGK